MALNRKYKALLLRAKITKVIVLHKTRKMSKQASDLELVIIHDIVTNELKERGIIDNE